MVTPIGVVAKVGPDTITVGRFDFDGVTTSNIANYEHDDWREVVIMLELARRYEERLCGSRK